MKIALKKFRLIMTVASVNLCLINEAFPFLALLVITRAAQQFAKKAVYQNVYKGNQKYKCSFSFAALYHLTPKQTSAASKFESL